MSVPVVVHRLFTRCKIDTRVGPNTGRLATTSPGADVVTALATCSMTSNSIGPLYQGIEDGAVTTFSPVHAEMGTTSKSGVIVCVCACVRERWCVRVRWCVGKGQAHE